MASNPELSIGIIGAGSIGTRHVSTLEVIGDVTVSAGCATVPAPLEPLDSAKPMGAGAKMRPMSGVTSATKDLVSRILEMAPWKRMCCGARVNHGPCGQPFGSPTANPPL